MRRAISISASRDSRSSGAYPGASKILRSCASTAARSASDPSQGAGAFIKCGTSDATTNGLLNVIETFHFKVDGSGGGSLKGSGAFVVNGETVGVCKASWRRTGPFGGKLGGCAP